jgi:hypothetical protein
VSCDWSDPNRCGTAGGFATSVTLRVVLWHSDSRRNSGTRSRNHDRPFGAKTSAGEVRAVNLQLEHSHCRDVDDL